MLLYSNSSSLYATVVICALNWILTHLHGLLLIWIISVWSALIEVPNVHLLKKMSTCWNRSVEAPGCLSNHFLEKCFKHLALFSQKGISEDRRDDNAGGCSWWGIEADIVYFRNGFHGWRSGMSKDLLEQLPNTTRWPFIVVVFTVRSEIYQPGMSLISTNSYWLSTKTAFYNCTSPLSFVWLTLLGSD